MQKIDNKLLLRTFVHFLSILYRSNKLAFICITLIVFITSTSSLIDIYFLKYILDNVVFFGELSTLSVIIILFYASSKTLWNYLDGLIELLKVKIRDSVNPNLQSEYFKKLNAIPYHVFEDSRIYDTIKKIDSWIDYKPTLIFFSKVTGLFSALIQILLTSIIIINLGIIPFLVLLIFTTPQYLIRNKIGSSNYHIIDVFSPVWRIFAYLTNLAVYVETKKEVMLYNAQDRLWKKILNIINSFSKENWTLAKRNFWLVNLAETLQIAGQLIVIYFFVILKQNSMPISNLIANIFLISLFTNSIMNLMNRLSEIRTILLSFTDYIKLLDMPNENRGDEACDLHFDSVEFKNVSFKYGNTGHFVLTNLNFKFIKGDKFAIVGLNGSGKTTLIKLMLRFYEPTSGEILFNGVDVSKIELNQYLKNFSALFQDFTKYALSVRDNIEFGNPNIIDEKLYKKSIFQADAEEIINSLENKDEQILTKTFEHGTELSVGQWQRIALARMYFRNANILIMDEPTASIDALSEHKIFKRVREISNDKSVIIISHRFSTVREANKIIVLSEGKIIEQGTHEELLVLKGLYFEMFTMQAEGYK